MAWEEKSIVINKVQVFEVCDCNPWSAFGLLAAVVHLTQAMVADMMHPWQTPVLTEKLVCLRAAQENTAFNLQQNT